MSSLDVGVFLPTMSATGVPLADVAASARHAEQLGFESVWVVDQLVAGTGNPFLDSVVSLSVAAGATTHVKLGFGVMILPLRPVVWVAKQVASLQHASGDRVLFGVGVGGGRHERSWDAAGVPVRERGRRTDSALAVLPGLLAGQPTRIEADRGEVTLAPGVTVPPILVGGMADAAVARAVQHGDAWFLPPMPPAEVSAAVARIASVAHELGGPTPSVTASIMIALADDPSVPDDAELVRILTDVDGMYGMPREVADGILVRGTPCEVAGLLAAYRDAGATRVVATVAAGDWRRQVEALSAARALLDRPAA